MTMVLLAATGISVITAGGTAIRRALKRGLRSPDLNGLPQRAEVRPARRSRRLAAAVAVAASVIALASLSYGYTAARLSSQARSATSRLTAGTLTFQSTAAVTCTNSNITPGATLTPCQLPVTYSGSSSAYVGLDVLIVTKPGVGGTALFTGNSSGLTFTLSDGANSYAIPTSSFTGASCTALGGTATSTCYQAMDEIAAASNGHTTWLNSDAATFTLTPSFPTTFNGGYSGGTATVTLTAHATQSANNPIPAGCLSGGNPVVGAACTGIQWS